VRRLAWVTVPVLSLVPALGFALALGELTLNSALNEPFDAEIRLLAVRPGELREARVGLASREAFARAGMDRALVLNLLDLEVQERPDGRAAIAITSRDPIKEPFLSFLVELTWSDGRLVREYTLLLDPPGYAAPAGVQAPRVAPSARGTVAAAPAPRAPAQAARTYGPTRRNDTLWAIAERVRPDRSLSLQQVMLALQRANPDAFRDGNVNRLRTGRVLTIPESAEMARMGKAEARGEFSRQYQAWKAGRSALAERPRPQPESAQTRTSPPQVAQTAEAAAPAEQAPPRLKLVTPTEVELETGEATRPLGLAEGGGGPTEQAVASLRRERDLAQEAAHTAEQENRELREQAAELKSQLADLDRLIKLKEADIAALREQLRAAEEERPSAAPPAPTAPAAPAPTAALFDNPMLVMGAGAALVLILGGVALWLVRRRRGAAQAGMEEGFEELEQELYANEGAPGWGGGEAKAEGRNVLAEVDLAIAYGRYDEARELLDGALAEEPNRLDLKNKLLEVHSAAGDTKAFDTLAEDVYQRLGRDDDHPVWRQVAEMGRRLSPGNPLYRGGEEPPAAAPAVPLAAAGAAAAAAGAQAAPSGTGGGEEEHIDFDLGFLDELEGQEGARDTGTEAGGEPSGTAAGEMELGELEAELERLSREPGAGEAGGGDLEGLDLGESGAGSEGAGGLDLGFATAEPAAPGRGDELEALDFDLGLGEEETGEPEPLLGGGPEEGGPDRFAAEPGGYAGAGHAGEELDEVATKLELARAYIDMGDPVGAREILEEVAQEGSADQKQEAEALIQQIA
jgi:pilus assembly protein FimV